MNIKWKIVPFLARVMAKINFSKPGKFARNIWQRYKFLFLKKEEILNVIFLKKKAVLRGRETLLLI